MEHNEELQLIEQILNGKPELFVGLLDKYSRLVYTLIVQIVTCAEDAQELTQDTFLKAFRNLSTYKKECRFSTWLYRIAYNTAISATRSKKREYLYIDDETINNVPDNKAHEPLCPSDNEEQISKLTHAIDQLNEEEKALIALFYYEEKPMEEIAEIMKITIANTKVKLHRTRKKLHVIMNQI